MDKVSKYIGRVCCVGRWAAGLMKLTVDWTETKYLLKTGYPTGHPWVRKNTCPGPVSFQVGYRWYPWVKNCTHTRTHWVGYQAGTQYSYLNCHPYSHSVEGSPMPNDIMTPPPASSGSPPPTGSPLEISSHRP
jgi:hypothetical protein